MVHWALEPGWIRRLWESLLIRWKSACSWIDCMTQESQMSHCHLWNVPSRKWQVRDLTRPRWARSKEILPLPWRKSSLRSKAPLMWMKITSRTTRATSQANWLMINQSATSIGTTAFCSMRQLREADSKRKLWTFPPQRSISTSIVTVTQITPMLIPDSKLPRVSTRAFPFISSLPLSK